MASTAYDWLHQSLNTIHKAHWHRSVRSLDGMAGPVMTCEGKRVINFASNDYLGLAGDPRLAEAAIAANRNPMMVPMPSKVAGAAASPTVLSARYRAIPTMAAVA
jgi:7-keto-8-aminopelargonate synthetase-like enzyme